MVKIEKKYVFETSTGKQSLQGLFDGRRQLIVYHFMFDPAWEKGCPGRTSYASTSGESRTVSQAHGLAFQMGVIRRQRFWS
jgi:predicted dithiol-disulfide oxidoreductase (DUF899 family)